MKPKKKGFIKIKVKIPDLQTKPISLFKGNVEASNFLNIGESTLRRYKNTKTLYLDRYLIENDELVLHKKKLKKLNWLSMVLK